MAKAKKKAGDMNLQALTVIKHDKEDIQPGKKFAIDAETGKWLVRINAAIEIKEENEEEEEDEKEEGKEGAE